MNGFGSLHTHAHNLLYDLHNVGYVIIVVVCLQPYNKNCSNSHYFLFSDPSCSNRELISCVEYLTSQQKSQLLLEIEQEFGPLEVAEIVQKLRLCNEFFPAFYAMVTELQDFLGENSYV